MQRDINPRISDSKLELLIGQYKYGRYCEDQSLPIEASRRLVLDQTRHYLAREDTQHIAVFAPGGQLLGLLLFRLSQWDTEHFGYRVALIDSAIICEVDYHRRVEITEFLLGAFHQWAQEMTIRFTSVRLPSLDLAVIHGFEQSGYHYLENWIYNKYDLRKLDKLSQPAHTLRLAQARDRDVMLDYADSAFITQRFHADAHIDQHKADSLYKKWIRTAFDDPNQQILCLDVEERPVAFMIYYQSDLQPYFGLQFAMWKMALLDPLARGRGLGTAFFTALAHYHRWEEGLDVVDSGLTIRNVASLNLHNKLNFKVICTLVTLHRWFEEKRR
ncbi:MAG: GNAT family N-acetyltransferase [Anaerolineae bacterium]|nr:GNAT family N-acetyltransferase [Anaerolineae bacterium]